VQEFRTEGVARRGFPCYFRADTCPFSAPAGVRGTDLHLVVSVVFSFRILALAAANDSLRHLSCSLHREHRLDRYTALGTIAIQAEVRCRRLLPVLLDVERTAGEEINGGRRW
jgi:hypothetical protein